MKKQIAILGSTGSIGTQALEVIEEHADLYEVYCLTANNKVQLLAEQAHKFKPAAIVIANEQRYDELKSLMSDLPDIKVYAGAKALDEIVEAGPIDMVLQVSTPPSTPSRLARPSVWPTRRHWWWPES